MRENNFRDVNCPKCGNRNTIIPPHKCIAMNQPDTEWEDFAQTHLSDVSPMTYSLISDFFKITRTQEYTRGREDEKEICKKIYVADTEWPEHGMDEIEGGMRFDELRRASDISATEK